MFCVGCSIFINPVLLLFGMLKDKYFKISVTHGDKCIYKCIRGGWLPVVNGGRTFHTVAQYNIVICDRDSFLFSRDIGELTFCVMDQIRLEY